MSPSSEKNKQCFSSLIDWYHLFKRAPPCLLVYSFLIPLPMSQSSQTACQLIFICLLSRMDNRLLLLLCLSLCDTLMTHFDADTNTASLWESWIQAEFALSLNGPWQILDLMSWLCCFLWLEKLQQTNSALFWCFGETHVQSDFLMVEEIWNYGVIRS